MINDDGDTSVRLSFSKAEGGEQLERVFAIFEKGVKGYRLLLAHIYDLESQALEASRKLYFHDTINNFTVLSMDVVKEKNTFTVYYIDGKEVAG